MATFQTIIYLNHWTVFLVVYKQRKTLTIICFRYWWLVWGSVNRVQIYITYTISIFKKTITPPKNTHSILLFLKCYGPRNREFWICSGFRGFLHVPKHGHGLSICGDTEIYSNQYRVVMKRQEWYKKDLEEERKVCGVSARITLL